MIVNQDDLFGAGCIEAAHSVGDGFLHPRENRFQAGDAVLRLRVVDRPFHAVIRTQPVHVIQQARAPIPGIGDSFKSGLRESLRAQKCLNGFLAFKRFAGIPK